MKADRAVAKVEDVEHKVGELRAEVEKRFEEMMLEEAPAFELSDCL